MGEVNPLGGIPLSYEEMGIVSKKDDDTPGKGRGFVQVPANAPVDAEAATATLTTSELGKNVTNTGASGTIVLTLPAASSCAGKCIRFQITAAQIVRVDPSGTESIFLGGSGAAGKYLNIAGVIGNYADLYCDGEAWHVTGYSGVLTKEA